MDAFASRCWQMHVFPWINCNKVVGNFVQQRKAGVCSPLIQCSPIQYFQHLSAHLAARRWIISILRELLFSIPFHGSQMEQQYSSCGWSNVVCTFALRDGDLTLKFRLRKPRVLFDLAVVLPMWVFLLRSCETCTPRYFVLCTDLIGTSWSVYLCMIGCFVRLMHRT